MKIVSRGLIVLAVCAAAGCGETPIPTSPSGGSLFRQNLSGVWLGDLRLATATGGECVGEDLRTALSRGGSLDEGTVSVSQTGSEMTARVRSVSTGLSCTYAGTSGASVFALSSQSCDEKEVFYQCANGQTRVLELLGSTMNAFASGGTANGVVASSYNVSALDANNQKRPIAGLTVQYRFDAVRP